MTKKQEDTSSLILRELKHWVNQLPEKFLDYPVVNGEEGKVDEQYTYRVDKPIIGLDVDEDTKEVLILTNPTVKPDFSNLDLDKDE